MPRPKLSEGEVERLHMLITKPELERIDDWRESLGLKSRAEAVRRLCTVGMLALGSMPALASMMRDLHVNTLDDEEKVGGRFRAFLDDRIAGRTETYSSDWVRDLWRDHSERFHWAELNAEYLDRTVAALAEVMETYTDPKPFTAAEREANAKLDALGQDVDMQFRAWDQLEQHFLRQEMFEVLRANAEAWAEYEPIAQDPEKREAFLKPWIAKAKKRRAQRRKRLDAKIAARRKKHEQSDQE